MKRILFLVGISMLLGCGMLKTSRLPASGMEAASTSRSSTAVSSPVRSILTWHVSAFTAEDLYLSRKNELKKKSPRQADSPGNIIDVTGNEVDPAIENMIEVIQIVDEENGNVIAAKIVNKP
ncbi:MAG: hypothetical protein A2071_04665 [Bacteroidetes bacterium GWC1_47_7]|nr:MAG: hypothetical protein A2071_04665 [Bacteroidetes bacterium GWC1_47_7]